MIRSSRIWKIAACALLALAPPALAEDEPSAPKAEVFEAAWTFDEEADLERLVGVATGAAARRMPKPKRAREKLYLLESWMESTGAVGMPAPADALTRVLEGSWQLILNTGTEGMGFLWLPIEAHGADGAPPEVKAWEAPSLAGAFGIGFDASNPPNRDPFGGSGNAHDRPQHEVSLHWDGMEIVKRMTPKDFRDEEPHQVRLRVAYEVGGANVSVWLDDEPLWEDYFLPTMTPYVGRPAFGARNAATAGDILLDDIRFRLSEPMDAPEAPVVVPALERVLNDKANPKHEAEVTFPEDTTPYGRILMTLRLDKPETRFDPWDRLAAVYAYADDGERFELLRYITPYHRGHVWTVDVSAFRPLLTGTRRIEQVCSTQGEGWVVSVSFAFYPGPADRYAFDVVNLWSGQAIVGNPEKPVAEFYVPKVVDVPEGAAFAEVRTVVTGHGMSPNSQNAAEFMPIERTLTIDGTPHRNRLWKEDNYLNPCRPQGGTWKYDRAGWAPGDVVRPWIVDATPFLEAGKLEIEYALAPYVNENRGKTWEPFHKTEGQVVFYREP